MALNQSLQATNLADILERVLDKGIVIAGDVSISLVDIELLTIRLRLLIASVDKAKEMGINWWEADPMLCARTQAVGTAKPRAYRYFRAPSANWGSHEHGTCRRSRRCAKAGWTREA